jgi:hypothetical protein
MGQPKDTLYIDGNLYSIFTLHFSGEGKFGTWAEIPQNSEVIKARADTLIDTMPFFIRGEGRGSMFYTGKEA